jgi:uncharacterized membrane protein YdjX (TVP38/TMEM64 family)
MGRRRRESDGSNSPEVSTGVAEGDAFVESFEVDSTGSGSLYGLSFAVLRRYRLVAGSVLVLVVALDFVVEALGVPLLTDPTPWLERGGALAALVGVSLLVIDVILPVPSSLVMVAHGGHFGVVIGTLLSAIGSIGAALVGFALGRWGGRLLVRLVPPRERT